MGLDNEKEYPIAAKAIQNNFYMESVETPEEATEVFIQLQPSLSRHRFEVEAPITQRKILLLVSSVFDPIGLFAPFSVHKRRLLKGIWIMNGQYWDNEVESGDEEEFLRWKQQLPIVAETSIDRRYFNRERDKTELHVFADASEDIMCAVAYLRSQPK